MEQDQALTQLTLLETGFPYADVSAVARADRFIPDAVYSSHKWWARRPPSIIRALLLRRCSRPIPLERHSGIYIRLTAQCSTGSMWGILLWVVLLP